jgi:uncharacterized membrane protein YukC
LRRNPKNIFKVELINEKSKLWLILKGIGAGISIVFVILLAYFAFKTFDLSNSARLAKEYNEAQRLISIQEQQIESLKNIVENYT